MRWRIATSCARRIFLIVSGHHDRALTVASFATTPAGRPPISPSPVTTPAAGAWPSYWSYATRSPISSQRSPGSSSFVTRSRAVSFPCSRCFLMRSGPPPCSRRAWSARYAAVRAWSRLTSVSGLDVLGGPLGDVANEVGGGAAGPEQLPDAPPLERLHILGGNDAAAGDQDVDPDGIAQQLLHPWEQGQVGTRQDRESHDVHVLLNRGLGEHLRRLMQARVDDLHAGVAQRRGHDFGAPVVSVQPRLGDEHADRPPPSRGHQRRNRSRAASPWTVRRALGSYTTSTCARWFSASSIASSIRGSSSWPSASRMRTWPRCSALSVGSMPLTAHPIPRFSVTASAWASSHARSRASRRASAASRTSAGSTFFGLSRTMPSNRSWRPVWRCGTTAAASTPTPAITMPASGRCACRCCSWSATRA